MNYSPAEINAAQLKLNRHPNKSPFWDSPDGQDVLEVARAYNLDATNTNAERCEIFRNEILAIGGEELLSNVVEDFRDHLHHLSV